MSRSRRKTRIFPIAVASSEKKEKRLHNRRMRRMVREQIAREEFDIFPVDNEISQIWCWSKDGKAWWENATKKDMSK